jgi:hypothetical protein
VYYQFQSFYKDKILRRRAVPIISSEPCKNNFFESDFAEDFKIPNFLKNRYKGLDNLNFEKMTVDPEWLGSYDKICSNCAGKRFLKEGEDWNNADGKAFGSTFEENYEYFLIQKIKKLQKEMERRDISRKKSFELSGKKHSKVNSEVDSLGTSAANSRDKRFTAGVARNIFKNQMNTVRGHGNIVDDQKHFNLRGFRQAHYRSLRSKDKNFLSGRTQDHSQGAQGGWQSNLYRSVDSNVSRSKSKKDTFAINSQRKFVMDKNLSGSVE